MKILHYLLATMYIAISCIVVLVMLVTSFERFEGKYFPSFMESQEFVLPLVVSILAVLYLFFFEPERLQQKVTKIMMRCLFVIELLLYSFYLATADMAHISGTTLMLYASQLMMILIMTAYFFKKNS